MMAIIIILLNYYQNTMKRFGLRQNEIKTEAKLVEEVVRDRIFDAGDTTDNNDDD